MRFVVVGALAILLAGCAGKSPCEDEIGAFVMAQEFVKRDLKAPASAEFPYITAEGVSSRPTTANGRCAFNVVTYVDAQNSFGAKLRKTYMVTLAPDPDGSNWSLISMTGI